MQVVKFSGRAAEQALAAAKALQAAAKEENRHKKAREAAREILTRLLADERQIVVDMLPVKEIVVVQCDGADVLKIERKGSDRFDLKAFGLEHAALQEKFTRETPATYFDSLLPNENKS